MNIQVLLVSNQVRGIDGTGGLGDVASALPKTLATRSDIDIRVLMLGYKEISGRELNNRFDKVILKNLSIPFGEERIAMDVCEYSLPKSVADEPTVICYLLCTDKIDNRFTKAIDSPEQAILLSRATVEFLRVFDDFRPDIIHCNDWHSGLISVYLNTLYDTDPYLGRIATLYTTHNTGYGYQGDFPTNSFPRAPQQLLTLAGLRDSEFLSGQTRSLEHNGQFNFAKGGLGFADLINTVSLQYAREIQTPAFGGGFDGLLRERSHDLCGIVDGIDTIEWNPLNDAVTSPHNYSKSYTATVVQGAKQNIRQHLLQNWKDKKGQQPFINLRSDSILIALVGRIAEQKFPILLPVLEDICRIPNVQVVILGNAHPLDRHGQEYAEKVHQLTSSLKNELLFYEGFDTPLSHIIYAAADMFLVPSTYEPCGLTQLISMRYGTVPIVRFVGGLVDTVIDEQAGAHANGFGFKEQINNPSDMADIPSAANLLLQTVQRAVGIKQNGLARWSELMMNGMARDSSWSIPAPQYMKLYHEAIARRVSSHFLL